MQSGIRVWSIRDIVLICAGSEITYVTAVSTWRLSFTGTANRELQSWDRAGSEQEVETKGIRKIELLKNFFLKKDNLIDHAYALIPGLWLEFTKVPGS